MLRINHLKELESLPYFTIGGFRQLLDGRKRPEESAREILSRWVQSGYILNIKRGVYMPRRFYELHRNDSDFSPAISAILLPQSYVSLEYVLQRENVLTDITYPVTAATLKNTRLIENSIGTFTFRHIKPLLYAGFSQRQYHGVLFHMASPAKALFDYLYLRPLPRNLRTTNLDIAEDLRLNVDDFDQVAQDEFGGYVALSASEKMAYIYKSLQRFPWQP